MNKLIQQAQTLAADSAIALALAPTEEELERRLNKLVDEQMASAGLTGPFTHEERMKWMDEYIERVLGEARASEETL